MMIPYRLQVLVDAAKNKLVDLGLSLVTAKLPLPAHVSRRKVVLIGASVGLDWRLHLVYPQITTLATYDFDKTELVGGALRRGADVIMIKECAAYFPADREVDLRREALVRSWVEQVRHAGAHTVLATVVPVTLAHDQSHPGRAASLWRFNDFLRTLAANLGVPLLDLERAVRVSDQDRHLRHDLHSGDGLHLQRDTYRRYLDHLVAPALIQALK
jgi:hypothetical protein